MKLKSLIVCVALLAIASIAVYYTSKPAPPMPADPRVGKALLDPATASSVVSIHLSDQGKSVDVARDSAGLWVVKSYYDMPVDFSKLSQFVNDLVAAKVDRFVTASPDRLSRLEFNDSKIDLKDKDGKSVWAITLGKTPDSGVGRFFEFASEQKAFLTGLSDTIDAESKNWADAQLTNVKDSDVARVALTLLDGSTAVFTRAKPTDTWTALSTPTGKKVSIDKIAGILASVGSIRFSDSNEPADPVALEAKKHPESVSLTTFAGKTVTVVLSRKPEEKKLKAPVADEKSGPASLGKLADASAEKTAEEKPGDKKPGAPEFETIPAGPVFVAVSTSDKADKVNDEMARRAFQTDESVFTSVPAKSDDLFEPLAPAEPAAAKP